MFAIQDSELAGHLSLHHPDIKEEINKLYLVIVCIKYKKNMMKWKEVALILFEIFTYISVIIQILVSYPMISL